MEIPDMSTIRAVLRPAALTVALLLAAPLPHAQTAAPAASPASAATPAPAPTQTPTPQTAPPTTQPTTPLITPQQLAVRAAEAAAALRIIDIRDGRDDEGKTPYERGHIAGSVPAPYSRWRGPAANPGALPPGEKLTELVQSLGIGADTPVVVVYEGASSSDFGSAARVYWTLKAAGVKNLAILNGGLRAWRSAGLPVAAGAPPAVARSSFTVQLDPRLVATRAEVGQAVQAQRGLLLDARPARFFTGQTRHVAASTPGTIAGARNVDNAVWFAPRSGALLDTAQVQKVAQEQGLAGGQPTVSFCNTGHWAATNWFVLSEVLGHPEVKLYPESVVDWSNSGGAMDNVPSRLYQFWLQIKEATGNL
jgi:thiosulfate/3-mercaptopyruvate sulfurtransferase